MVPALGIALRSDRISAGRSRRPAPFPAMKTLRILFLLGAVAAVALTIQDYRSARETVDAFSGIEPGKIAADLASQSGAWTWEQTSADAAKVVISAQGFRQGKEAGAMELSGVLLKVFDDEGEKFDRIETADATFDINADRFRSNAQTIITLGVPADRPDANDPSMTQIIAARAEFDTKAGTAWTEDETHYRFEGGRGRSVGASYDSGSKYFLMKSAAEVERFGSGPGAESTLIRAGRLVYLEQDQRVDLRNGASLRRGGGEIDAAEATVYLEEGSVKRVEATEAVGREQSTNRTVTFRTPKLTAFYGERQTIERVVGEGSTELESKSGGASTEAAGNHMDLRYVTPEGGSDAVLDEAFVRGDARIVTRAESGERRVASEWLKLKMKPGGEEVSHLETLERGRADILSDDPAARRRLDADRIRADYGPENAMEILSATGHVELTSGVGTPSELRSWSQSLEARLEPASGELLELKQWDGFRFARGGKTGEAGEGVYRPEPATMELSTKARVEDTAGTISAHRITLFEREDRIEAQGDVATVYEQIAAKESDDTTGLFAPGKPVYATALAMTSDQQTGRVVYRGQARLWQEANRIEAEEIRIHRLDKALEAEGGVATFLREESPEGDGRIVEVRAENLAYAETDRTARYRGGVRMTRGPLAVESEALDAVMADEHNDASSIESAEARGGVRILDRQQGNRGTSDKALYFPGGERVELFGSAGVPAVAVNRDGEETRGERLTYRIGDDTLQVSGGESGRAYTFRRRDR